MASGRGGAGQDGSRRWSGSSRSPRGLSFGVLPVVPDTGKAHDGAVFHPDVERMFFPDFLRPLEKTACGDNAGLVADRGPECRLLVNRFVVGVDHAAADGGIFGPGGNEPPAHEGGPVAASVPRIVRTCWVGAMLLRGEKSQRVVTPKISAKSSGDMAKVNRPHMRVPSVLLYFQMSASQT